ncbi:hypothetical protein DICPUDRAFT_11972, partial [Dictyostelium purpureum]
CVLTDGSYQCECRNGWIKNPGNSSDCIDVDECFLENAGCAQLCINSEGSYQCDCKVGWTVDPSNTSDCVDINECINNNGGCVDTECYNTEGSYYCVKKCD